jgi:hypothetical protein
MVEVVTSLESSKRSPARAHGAAALVGIPSALLVVAYVTTVLMRLDLGFGSWVPRIALLAWVGLIVAVPRPASLAVFVALPLFGNHPGGSLMELLNLLLAACTLGLCLRAWRRRQPCPGGFLWSASLLVLFSAVLALGRSLPEAWIRMAQIDFLPSSVAQTLTAAETVPLYAIGSMIQLWLAIAWAYALCWNGADSAFAKDALRYLTLGLFATMAVGILDFHRLIDLRHDVLSRIDPRIDYLERFQSVFWNPGWFAWYFTMAFGLALGLLWLERPRARRAVALGLLISYVYFLTNSQRGGFLALHVTLLALAAALLWQRGWSWRIVGLAAGVMLLPIVGVELGLFREGHWFLALRRLLGPVNDINRRTLWDVATRMWRTNPLLGIGEGAFGWHYRDYVPKGSSGDIGAWGDSHSTWLQLLATRGVVGLVAFLALLTALCRRLVVAIRAPGPERGVGLGVAFGLVAFVVYATVQWMFYIQATQVLFWAMVALAAATAPSAARDSTPRSWRRRGLIAALLLAAVVLQVVRSQPLYSSAAAEVARQPRGFYGLARWGRRADLFRWSSRAGTLCLYPTGPVTTIQVLTTDPTAAVDPVTVSLSTQGRLLDRFDLRKGAVSRSFFLPEAFLYHVPAEPPPFGECLPGRPGLPLRVEVGRLWTPYLTGTLDARFLGVAVFSPTFSALEPGAELGLIPAPPTAEPGARWAAPRSSFSISLPAERSTLVARIGPAESSSLPVLVEAFWDERAVGSLSLLDERWQELRVRVSAESRRGVLTLQANRAWPLPMSGFAVDRRYAALRIGPIRAEPASPPPGAQP